MEDGELFEFDQAVQPVLEDHSTVSAGGDGGGGAGCLRAQQRAFQELRNSELAEVQRLQEPERRHSEEKQKKALEEEKEIAEKMAARACTQTLLADLPPRVFTLLRTHGFFYDPVEKDELDNLLVDNRKVMLQSIAADLRASLPLDAMLPSETATHLKMQQQPQPTVHVDAFLYDEEQVDALCEDGTMSRTYCLNCGSHRTAPLDFISHSFSVSELQFLFQNVLPDLSGRTLVDVGSRLGAVLYGGFVYSSAARLIGLELSEEFVKLQNNILHKYRLTDRVQVLHADVCTQDSLLHSADVLVMNNVFEYFMEPSEQVRAWRFIMQTFRRTGSLLVTVPSLQDSLNALQEALQPGWVEELPVDYDVYLSRDTDADALRQIHLYRVM
ncbi:uncharacterized protein LOC114427465 isoform X2 [Parambassis ranga]|uniref:Uncharacterized protein LOC114427465 isoform X2 n=1 Tax=Parambassis ranga TaxID=210632 RepID=A0A6P7HHM2_9TELE|nr:uncharacterized protein LOC114427465 isoform X2 [Parambassis ranga]